MSIPDITKFQEAMKHEMQRNKYREGIRTDFLEDGFWRNLKSYLKGVDREKSLIDLANYCAVIWNHLKVEGK